ncbi:MAG: protocatechuate 3,4-dioxygenase subunit beta [Candidatus Acidiferrales bacterium]
MRETITFPRPLAGSQPEYLYPAYVSTRTRSPNRPLVLLPHTLSEVTGPVFGHSDIGENDSDLTRQHQGQPLGERIIVTGRVLDEEGRPVPHALIELWQANAAGRYRHQVDNHDAPLDPNFSGCGRMLADSQGRYRFVTVKPGAYPWGNHHNAWRPAHIHFSLFGAGLLARLVTQMYFPGDPLLPFDPIYNSIPDENSRSRLVSAFDWETTTPGQALGYRFDIVLRGREATPAEKEGK